MTSSSQTQPPSKKTYQISVPATIANMGPGFDTFGMAVSLYNAFTVTFDNTLSEDTVVVKASTGSSHNQQVSIETSPADNMVVQAVDYVFKQSQVKGARPHLQLEITPAIPLARGLGSSSTAIVAGLLAANAYLGNPLSEMELVAYATSLEGHPDNVAPALLGGALFCDDVTPYALPWPPAWGIILVIPSYPVLTEDARRVLPRQCDLETAIFNLRKSSLLTYALLKQDAVAFSKALDDRLHQPYRKKLIAEYDTVSALAQSQGALGTIISGSGSTMAVFYQKAEQTELLSLLQSHPELASATVMAVNPSSKGGTVHSV